ncbi:ABC transporter permease [Nesterenkonia ebinurensis]|uniref:ABC transporter permease n=1 Tax=Nesterenkonia ebinurensis TaxID=2608252 RepID=UPI00168AC221|nr:ABC transporter permease [Nesterenkonia ebinurensis]
MLGLIAGYYRASSVVIMRIMDAMMSFPAIVLAITLVIALSSQAGALALVIALIIVFVPYVARVVRSRTLSLAERGFVTAARGSGVRGWKIIVIHILPNLLPTIMVQATFVYAQALLSDAALSFLGLGVPPPTPTWGNMIADARNYIESAPLFIISPGVAIVVAVMAFNVVGDSLRTLIDPRARSVADLRAAQRRHKIAGHQAYVASESR